MRKGSALEHAIRRGERRRAFGRAVAEMPDDTAPDDRGQIDPLSETTAVFLIGEDIRRQRQATPGQHRDVLPGMNACQLDTNIHLWRITAHNAVHRCEVAEMLKAPPHDFRAGAVAPTAPHKPAELGDPGDGLA